MRTHTHTTFCAWFLGFPNSQQPSVSTEKTDASTGSLKSPRPHIPCWWREWSQNKEQDLTLPLYLSLRPWPSGLVRFIFHKQGRVRNYSTHLLTCEIPRRCEPWKLCHLLTAVPLPKAHLPWYTGVGEGAPHFGPHQTCHTQLPRPLQSYPQLGQIHIAYHRNRRKTNNEESQW